MNKPTHIILHNSDSSFGGAITIDGWHRGQGWDKAGYHYIVNNGQVSKNEKLDFMDGMIEKGRQDNETGSHAKGWNNKSLGICLIGRGMEDYTLKQYENTIGLIQELMTKYNIPVENVLGHRELPNVTKLCPYGVDMDNFRLRLRGSKVSIYG